MYRGMRAKKLEKQVFDLKSKLLDKQSELIKNIETKFTTSADTIKQENDKKLDLYKKENEKVVSQVQYDFETLGKKLDTLIKKK